MSTWTRVYYNNALALAFWPPYLVFGKEYAQLIHASTALLVPRTCRLVVASCVLGIGISFTGFGFRNLVTATTFTVVGVMNKVLTVLASIILLGGTSSPLAVASLVCCIGGGTLYRQAPSRAAADGGDEMVDLGDPRTQAQPPAGIAAAAPPPPTDGKPDAPPAA